VVSVCGDVFDGVSEGPSGSGEILVQDGKVAAIAGATTYVVLNAWNLGNALVVTASTAVGLALRLIAVQFGLNLPTERPEE
jgi:hypothetical protein